MPPKLQLQSFLKQHQKKIFAGLCATALLLQFNNCGGKLNSQFGANPSDGSSFAADVAGNLPDTPVDPANPYYVQCISSSDGARISGKLSQSVQLEGLAVSGKLSSLDWKQDRDLIVTLDNDCLRAGNYTDPMLIYVHPNDIQTERPYTVYTIQKESVPNLKLFIENALSSECLLAAEKNEEVRIKADVADPNFSSLRHLAAVGASDAVLGTVMAYNGGRLADVKVAIVDTGIDTSNPDLRDQIARDGNGNVIGYNSTTSSSDFLTDSGYHGTHVAGLVAAGFRNGIAGSGIFGRHVKLYPVRGSNNGDTFQFADLANAIIWAADQGVDLINLSLGTPSESLTIKNAISYAIGKNVAVVVAAGNDGYRLSTSDSQYPAMYTTQFQGLISVGSLDAGTGQLSGFSNYSGTYVDILAPGSNGSTGIYSTVPVAKTSNGSGFASKTEYEDGTIGPIQGTSMASPLVTGALAAGISMAKGRGFSYTPAQLETLLKEGSPKNPSYTSYSANGLYLNLPVFYNQVRYRIESVNPPTTYTVQITQQPTAKKAVAGETVEIRVEATGSTALTYQWYRNDVKINGATSNKLTFTGISDVHGGQYYAEITAGTKKVTTQKVALTVGARYCN